MVGNPSYGGQRDFYSDTSLFNALSFMIRMLTGNMATATLVQVKSVTVAVDGSATGRVSVQPMVNQIDGEGNATPHGIIYDLPYFRLQGGANAVIMDPAIGDIGMAVFASRDLSAVKNTRAVANPGSRRRFDMADGLYMGGFLNGAATQYIDFTGGKIKIVSPTEIDLTAPVISIHATTKLKYDANGNGTEITTNTRDDYVTGSVNSTHPLNPPQIP